MINQSITCAWTCRDARDARTHARMQTRTKWEVMKYNRRTCPVAELQHRSKLLSVRFHGRVLEFMDALPFDGLSPSAELGPNLH